jgi:hypothetical protein
MTHNSLIEMNVCDGCHRPQGGEIDSTIATWSAHGDRHYCNECWPSYRDHYEENGQRAWKRIGNRYVPNE